MTYDPPLSGIEILDLSTGPMTEVAHLLADLGAHVTAVRLAGVTADDTVGPYIDAIPIGTAITRAGIAGIAVELETPAGQQAWTQLLAGADILIENTRPGSPAEALLAIRQIRVQHPALVILSISDFGRDSSYRSWQATTPVLHALTSELSRSGIPGRVPLLPPGPNLPYQVAAAQAALFTVSVYLDRLRCGTGDLIDFSVLEGAMQALDPPFGTAGSASAGVPVSEQQRDWAAEQQRYPIIRCKDGHIRICLLAKRQWQGMFEWMGRPEEFADPRFNSLRERFASAELLSAIDVQAIGLHEVDARRGQAHQIAPGRGLPGREQPQLVGKVGRRGQPVEFAQTHAHSRGACAAAGAPPTQFRSTGSSCCRKACVQRRELSGVRWVRSKVDSPGRSGSISVSPSSSAR